MCGITAIFGKAPQSSDLEAMLSIASRRGPEATNTAILEDGLIGHTALAFVNVGNNPQPLSENGATLVYNGEIYNWRELNEQYHLNASNDTELLLRGLVQQGPDFLQKIEGQFAFIAQTKETTIVGRDRYGISPLVFGHNSRGELVIASTPEAVAKAGVQQVKTIPAGTYGLVKDNQLDLTFYFQLVPAKEQTPVDPKEILAKAIRSVVVRIPEQQNILYTAMGGIDSQFVTATIARQTRGNFGGAITVVPWDPQQPENLTLGDYFEAKATVEMLQQEGITINHYVVQLTPQYVDSALDRLLKVLGPDYFNICCGLAEDLVATTAKKYGGKAIMTAGGPDEAGRSYKNWTLQYKDNLDAGFYAVCDQFASSEGVRAGLVFGELGLENRVPLAFLIEESMSVPAEQKQIVKSWGDGSNPTTILMEDKIFWRQALDGILPKRSLRKPKETIHSASGAKLALQYVADNDQQYQIERQAFRTEAEKLGWFITFDDYCLWRWSKLEPEKFAAGANAYYGVSNGRELSYSFELEDKIARPICYDWLELN